MSEDTYEFTLPSGETVVIDADDRELVEKWGPWFALQSSNGTYVQRNHRDGQAHLLHRLLLSPPDGLEVDHANGDPLDNRRSNLRPCTSLQNKVNTPPFAGGTSQFKGVFWEKDMGRWRAQSRLNGSKHHLGYFDDEVEAARAYDEFAESQWGEFAWLNREHFDLGERAERARTSGSRN